MYTYPSTVACSCPRIHKQKDSPFMPSKSYNSVFPGRYAIKPQEKLSETTHCFRIKACSSIYDYYLPQTYELVKQF